MRGKFITFEGCEGAGKSRQITLLADFLKSINIDFIITREPGGTSISEKIRSIILDGKNLDMTDECEALLYAAARAQHLTDTVEPALKAGKLVICDRYIDSSFAYQGYARGLDINFIKNINSFAINKYMPDLTLFLDISPEDSFKRKGGADIADRLEMCGMDFHKKVYDGYLELIKEYPKRIKAIYSLGAKTETHANIIKVLVNSDIIKL
jgi:dTMP kinase